MKKRFKTILEGEAHSQVAKIVIPFDVEKAFGTRGRTPVRGTINGFPFRTSIFPRSGGEFYMVVNRVMRTGANVKAGDRVEVILERDDQPRLVKVPSDLARAIRESRAAEQKWKKLSYSHQKEWVTAIEAAKKPETRTRRIEKAIAALSTHQPKP